MFYHAIAFIFSAICFLLFLINSNIHMQLSQLHVEEFSQLQLIDLTTVYKKKVFAALQKTPLHTLPSSFHSLPPRENIPLLLSAHISLIHFCILYEWHQTWHTILCLVFKLNTVRFIHIVHAVIDCLFSLLSRISSWKSTKFYLPILTWMDISVFSSFWLLTYYNRVAINILVDMFW